jgi:hypothetical protein
VQFYTPPGEGRGFDIRMNVAGQIEDTWDADDDPIFGINDERRSLAVSSVVVSYIPPEIEFLCANVACVNLVESGNLNVNLPEATGFTNGYDGDGNRVKITLFGKNFGTKNANRFVDFGGEAYVNASNPDCDEAGLTCTQTKLELWLPVGQGFNLDVSLNAGGLPSNDRKFSYVPPLISALSTIDKYGILQEEYPTSGCYDDRFSRNNSRGELFCDNPKYRILSTQSDSQQSQHKFAGAAFLMTKVDFISLIIGGEIKC